MLRTNYNDLALLIHRVCFSALMLINHGIPKIDILSKSPIEFADPLGVGATTSLILCLIGEVLAPVLIIFGIKTKLASIPALITMGVAVFVVHSGDPLAQKEMALLYFIAFLVVFFAGPGKYSMDGRKGR